MYDGLDGKEANGHYEPTAPPYSGGDRTSAWWERQMKMRAN